MLDTTRIVKRVSNEPAEFWNRVDLVPQFLLVKEESVVMGVWGLYSFVRNPNLNDPLPDSIRTILEEYNAAFHHTSNLDFPNVRREITLN